MQGGFRRLVTNPPIGEALALGSLDRDLGALAVAVAQVDAVCVAGAVLVEVAV